MNVAQLLRTRDPGLAALRRSCRAGIIAPGLFALSQQVIDNPTIAIFSAFGSIALLLFVDFGGPMRERLAAQVSLILTGAVLLCLGTLASRTVWSAALAMAVVGFAVLFSGVVSSVLAGSSTSLLVSFIMAVALPAPPGQIPQRLAGWFLAGAASLIAVGLLWPLPAREPLRFATARACALLARRLRAEVDCVRGGLTAGQRADRDALAAEAGAAVAGLRASFFGTPYRPTGLTAAARTLVRLVDEVVWLEEILRRTPPDDAPGPSDAVVCEVKLAAADLLELGALRLESAVADQEGFQRGLRRLRDARAALEQAVTSALPDDRSPAAEPPADVTAFVGSLEPGFRAQELSYAVAAIARNMELTILARDRSWWQRLLGRQPAGVPTALSAVRDRAGAHVDRHSVWLHNSVRGGIALGLAVLVAELTGVQHSFWVVFGTMAVLRSNALLIGQNALRALLGTVGGIVVGAGLIFAVGSDTTVFWCLLPAAIVFTGLAPAAISFAAGQAGFTAALLILFNIIDPAGWTIGLVRIEDIAIGVGVSAGVGVLFWPRGAAAALGRAMGDGFAAGARYLLAAVEYGVTRCDALVPTGQAPDGERREAAAAARRLDDAFREFLAEHGTKRLPLADVTVLVTAVAVLRLTADAISDLWSHDDGAAAGDRAAARAEILRSGVLLGDWYRQTARALAGDGGVPGELAREQAADGRLIEAVRRDLTGGDGSGRGTAIKLIWTADHLDVARRFQIPILEPARAAAASQRRTRRLPAVPGFPRRPAKRG